jgi:hypothetical protein
MPAEPSHQSNRTTLAQRVLLVEALRAERKGRGAYAWGTVKRRMLNGLATAGLVATEGTSGTIRYTLTAAGRRKAERYNVADAVIRRIGREDVGPLLDRAKRLSDG